MKPDKHINTLNVFNDKNVQTYCFFLQLFIFKCWYFS